MTLGNFQAVTAILEIMDARFIDSLRTRIERACTVRQAAIQRMQRTETLLSKADLLFARFDELERQALLRISALKSQKPTGTL